MAKSYRYDPDEPEAVDTAIRKRMAAKRYRDRIDDEYEEHERSQTRDHRASLPVNRFRY